MAHLDADSADPAPAEETEDEDNLPAGPVTIAVDLNDSADNASA
jgi:hypothetical protein